MVDADAVAEDFREFAAVGGAEIGVVEGVFFLLGAEACRWCAARTYGLDDVELVLMLLAGFLPVVGVGENFIGDGDLVDEDFDVFGKTVSLGATGFCGL